MSATMSRLEGKRTLVTGASRGIGLATARRFAAEGAVVLGVDLEIDDAARELAGVEWIEADVCDEQAMTAAASAAAAAGRLDACVANAGIGGVEGFLEAPLESWRRTLEINLLGVMVTLRAAAREMTDGAGGRLLVTSSIAAIRGEANAPAYAASKGGVAALVRALAVELAPQRITVNAVAPGQIDTELNARDVAAMSAREGRDPAALRDEHLASNVPAGRMGTPEEVAAAFAFLASPEADFISGTTLRIDGGELAV